MTAYQLTRIQQDVWVDQSSAPDIPLYNIGGYLVIRGAVDPGLCEQAVCRVIAENDACSIRLHPPGQNEPFPTQSFEQTRDWHLPFVDFSAHADAAAAAMDWIRQEISRPFELYGQPLFRFGLLKVSEDLHFFLQCQHHLVSDGYSNVLLSQRIARIYNELLCDGSGQETCPLYRDYIEADRRYFESKQFHNSRDFWRRTFRHVPEGVVPHPSQRADPAQQLKSGIRAFRVDARDFSRLQTFCTDNRLSLFHLALAALAIYYARALAVGEVVFGAPLMNRGTAVMKGTIGLFTSMCPVLLRLEPDWSVTRLLSTIRSELKGYYRYQRFPLSEIHRLLGLSGKHLFELVVSYEQFDFDVRFGEAPVEMITLANGYQRNALAIALKEYHKGQGLEAVYTWNVNAFEETEIASLFERFHTLLMALIRSPDARVRDLGILPPREQTQLMQWALNERPHAPGRTALDLFLDQVRERPGAVALQVQGQQYSYRRLARESERLAGRLQARGYRLGERIAVCLPRVPEWIVAVVAILRLGGIYVPVDPEYPGKRKARILTGSHAACILTRGDTLGSLPPGDLPVIRLDDLPAADIAFNAPVVGPADSAYIIFTSGSTGLPKGVLLHHEGLYNLVAAQIRLFRLDPDSRLLQFASSCFDASISEIMTAICCGGTLVLADKESLRPGPALVSTLNGQAISHVTLPPSTLAVLPDDPLPALRVLVVAGEACPLDLARKWAVHRVLINAYGPTESTVCASTWAFREEAPGMVIGTPMDNTELYVLDDGLAPLPVNVFGELYIGGRGLAVAYLDNPERTAERFLPSPFARRSGERLYKSGDRARWRFDGTVELAGRTDRQIKLRGFRIEPGEIEACLDRHPGIRQSAVDARSPVDSPAPSGGQSPRLLVAWYLPESSAGALRESELRDYLGAYLPQYMLPSRYLPVEVFPQTPNGKIDLDALTLPTAAQAGGRTVAGEAESRLLALWAEVMPGFPIEPTDDLFEKGMDSLRVVHWITRVEAVFGQELPLSELYRLKTPRSLAEYLDRRADQPLLSALVPVKPYGSRPPLFCVTAGYGDLLALTELSRLLHEEQPFYVLQPPEDARRSLDMVHLVAHYLSLVETVGGGGGVHLAGYSVGGVVAFEMARQLHARGRRVEALVLMGAPYNEPLFGRRVHDWLLRFLPKLLPKRRSARFAWLRILQSLFDDQGLKIHLQCVMGYDPDTYFGKVTVLEGRFSSSRFIDWQEKWGQLCPGGVEVDYLPGNHDSFIRPPHNKTLARRLGQLLDSA